MDVCQDAGIYAVLDLHQDAVAGTNCGEGMPTWISKLAVPDLIGKPLAPVPEAVAGGDLPADWPMLPDGSCGSNDTDAWSEHAGDVDYNIRNSCCRHLNGGSWGALGYSTSAQGTMSYLLDESGDGPDHYAKYVELLVKAVAKHPHAVGIGAASTLVGCNRRARGQLSDCTLCCPGAAVFAYIRVRQKR